MRSHGAPSGPGRPRYPRACSTTRTPTRSLCGSWPGARPGLAGRADGRRSWPPRSCRIPRRQPLRSSGRAAGLLALRAPFVTKAAGDMERSGPSAGPPGWPRPRGPVLPGRGLRRQLPRVRASPGQAAARRSPVPVPALTRVPVSILKQGPGGSARYPLSLPPGRMTSSHYDGVPRLPEAGDPRPGRGAAPAIASAGWSSRMRARARITVPSRPPSRRLTCPTSPPLVSTAHAAVQGGGRGLPHWEPVAALSSWPAGLVQP